MEKWSSIEQFRHVVATVRSRCDYDNVPLPELLFRGTVKLHGTNAGIHREHGVYTAQGRTRTLTVEDDNYGFARWLHDSLQDETFATELDAMFDSITSDKDAPITVYGEWCGKGIQKNVAVAQLPKRFVIFGARVDGRYVANSMSLYMPSSVFVDNILVAGTYLVGVNFEDPQQSLEQFEKLTLDVEQCCPYAKLYGVEGIGEGIVWTCMENPSDSSLWFKTKGEKHASKSNKTKNVATIDPVKLEKIQDVVDYVLSPSRLQQGLEHVDDVTIKCMGQYLKWVGQDVQKEESDTIEANGLEWKDISKRINEVARNHFMTVLDERAFSTR